MSTRLQTDNTTTSATVSRRSQTQYNESLIFTRPHAVSLTKQTFYSKLNLSHDEIWGGLYFRMRGESLASLAAGATIDFRAIHIPSLRRSRSRQPSPSPTQVDYTPDSDPPLSSPRSPQVDKPRGAGILTSVASELVSPMSAVRSSELVGWTPFSLLERDACLRCSSTYNQHHLWMPSRVFYAPTNKGAYVDLSPDAVCARLSSLAHPDHRLPRPLDDQSSKPFAVLCVAGAVESRVNSWGALRSPRPSVARLLQRASQSEICAALNHIRGKLVSRCRWYTRWSTASFSLRERACEIPLKGATLVVVDDANGTYQNDRRLSTWFVTPGAKKLHTPIHHQMPIVGSSTTSRQPPRALASIADNQYQDKI
ncbi:hypothetical protein DFP72DRAFT_1069371 [Ephemerocybe angulata]|uniref:Uncharacterized protein n=1 Tax=Ephemerocybe angulata TaxID=980116 RepID=A0A8H6M5Y7_9AGAR|nr:hypothetical protein DFP72DRAFT_1069371 [Tulosesus angulatus]